MLLAIPVTTGDLLPTEGYLSAVLVYIEGPYTFFVVNFSNGERCGTYLMISINV